MSNKKWSQRFGPNKSWSKWSKQNEELYDDNLICELESNVSYKIGNICRKKSERYRSSESNRIYWYEFTSYYPIKQKIKYRNINKWFNKK